MTTVSSGPSSMAAGLYPGRSIQACLDCRKSKLKCDGMTKPDSICSRCRKRGKTCHWSVQLPFAEPVGDARAQQGHHPSRKSATVSKSEQPISNKPVPPPAAGSGGGHQYNGLPYSEPSPYETSTSSSSNQAYSNTRKRASEHQSQYPHSRRRSPSWSGSPREAQNQTRSVSPATSGPMTNPAPLVAIREVALLSPEADKVDAYPIDPHDRTAAQGANDPFSKSRAEHDAVLAEMDALQSQSGWTKADLAEISGERRHFFESAIAGEPESLRFLDPLEQGVISMSDAERYFMVYYESINSQHCLLDPIQDTWQAVRNRSRGLFITVVAAASCIDIQQTSVSRRTSLTDSMDDAIAQILMANAKSPDVVKALLLAYLFTQKPDRVSGDKCWLLVDTASRTASELGLGIRLRTPQASVTNSDTYSFRNAERAWIFSQVMQRSLGTSTGLWSIGKMDVKWDKLEAWCECRDALPGDVEHVAFLFLRRLEYHARSQFEDIDADRFSTLESIRASFNALFDNWRRRWVEHPKLVNENISRSFLLIVGLHIQLLINVTALKLAEGSKGRRTDFSRDMSPDLQPFCTRLAIELCQTFITSFFGKAHILCRNIVSMVTWSAMALLQMEADRGRMLVLRVALMLAGDAQDRVYRTTLSAFFGRSLLSLVNDLTISGSSRRHHRHGEGHHHKHGSRREAHSSSHNDAHIGTSHNIYTPKSTSSAGGGGGGGMLHHSTPGSTSDSRSINDLSNERYAHGGQMISAERMLSTMAGPLSADPYNEQWLNQFLDNMAPIALPSAAFEGRQQMLAGEYTVASAANNGGNGPSTLMSNGFEFAPPLPGSNGPGMGNGAMFGNRTTLY